MIRVGFGFVLLSFVFKLLLKRLNGFDVLALIVLAAGALTPLTGEAGVLIEMVLFACGVAVLAASGGAGRRGVLFISAAILLSDVMVGYEHFVDRRADDPDACTPVDVGAAAQALLFCFVCYATVHSDGGSYRPSSDEERENEMRAWLAAVIAVSTIRSAFAARECRSGKHEWGEILTLLRVGVLAGVCVINGEDEMKRDEDY